MWHGDGGGEKGGHEEKETKTNRMITEANNVIRQLTSRPSLRFSTAQVASETPASRRSIVVASKFSIRT